MPGPRALLSIRLNPRKRSESIAVDRSFALTSIARVIWSGVEAKVKSGRPVTVSRL